MKPGCKLSLPRNSVATLLMGLLSYGWPGRWFSSPAASIFVETRGRVCVCVCVLSWHLQSTILVSKGYINHSGPVRSDELGVKPH